jgi:glycosyltransferase involved in cell wall biosynthesis
MSKKGKIAYICPRFAQGAVTGGAETLIKSLATVSQASGWDVTFLTTCATNHFEWKNDVPEGSRIIDGLKVKFFKVDQNRNIEVFLKTQEIISNKSNPTAGQETDWLRNSVNSSSLYNYLRDKGSEYDLILTGPYLFGLTFFASEIHPEKTVLIPCLHDEGFAYIDSFHKMFNNVKGIMFNTEPEKNLAKRLYNIPERKCSVVGMGLNNFEVPAGDFRKEHNFTQPYILYSGRREPAKGIPLLLDYVDTFCKRTSKDIKLVFTGTGEINANPAFKKHIIDIGFVSEQEKYRAMAGATAFCHPSVYESFGIVILESWLANTPVLVNGKSEVNRYHCIKSNGGLWFNIYPEFEEELLFLLNRPAVAEAMGNSGKEYVLKNYSWQTVRQKLNDALVKFMETEK